MERKHTNSLINATSPYLLQHAHNPVNWQAWDDSAFQQAKDENKLVLVSVGYAACHWCHVMEHESFEDEEVAEVMNENFVCIKVDREERPDVDHYYMTAVQLIGQQGGWPLNVVALPDGRPVWGGTYFPKEMWVKNLDALANFYRQKTAEMETYADDLQKGIQQVSLISEPKNTDSDTREAPLLAVEKWKERFDLERGGMKGQPKFPMPVNHDFLLYYGYLKNDKNVLGFVEKSLDEMARGGIYDQVGGGFARYSVDEGWKVPHFEKMLYDNAQLISLYSKGSQLFKKEEYKNVVYETIDFLQRELMDSSGAFYSSLDADSEGEEGKFYVWEKQELQELLASDFEVFADYFNINSKGYWEDGQYILLRDKSTERFAEENRIPAEELNNKVRNWKEKLLKYRSGRARPGLDDKTLTSWNALVLHGLVDAYKAFQDETFLSLAKRNAEFLRQNVMTAKGALFHTWKKNKSSVRGFMEDYALLVQAFISLFEVSGEKLWLKNASKLTDYAFEHFYDDKSGLFFYSEKDNDSLLTNHYQNEDNVLPAANSVMANNLHKLYLIYGKPEYLTLSEKMLKHAVSNFVQYPMAYSKWGELILKLSGNFYEIVVTGKDARKLTGEMQPGFHPNVIWAFTTRKDSLPLFYKRYVKGKSLIYVCREGTCQLPVTETEKAIEMIQPGGDKD